MKKITSFLSPYLVLTLPVLLFVGISFAIGTDVAQTSAVIPTYKLGVKTETVIKECPKSFIISLLK